MMVQSTIDKIRDTSVYRTIRKLCGVIDEQNTVVENLQNELDAFDLDGVKTDVTKLKTNDAAQDTKITAISDNVANLDENVETNTEDITYLKSSVSSQNSRLTNAETDILNLRDEDKKLTNALPKTYTLYRNGEGKIQAQVETIDGTLFNSNILDMIIPYQYDIISGTTERSFKLDITMSDGSKYTTNDFIIPAGGGTEVVVTGITLAKDSSNVNRFHVGINLSDGTMIDSGYISMVDNVVATYADSKLTISVNGVSSVPVAIETGSNYTAGTGITITSGTIAIDDTVVALKSDIADMLTKTDADAEYATKTALALTDSVANDANEKANSAIDNVSISGSTMTFTKINDEHIDVVIPSFSVVDKTVSSQIYVEVKSTISTSTYVRGFHAKSYGNKLVKIGNTICNVFDGIAINFNTLANTILTTDTYNNIATTMLNGFELEDGNYYLTLAYSSVPVGDSHIYITCLNITISDGEITNSTLASMDIFGNYSSGYYYFSLISLQKIY